MHPFVLDVLTAIAVGIAFAGLGVVLLTLVLFLDHIRRSRKQRAEDAQLGKKWRK